MASALGIKGMREIFPLQYMDMLYEIYNPKEVDMILKSYITGRKTTFRINKLKDRGYEVIQELKSRGIKAEKCRYSDDVYILKNGSERVLQMLDSYKKGYIYLQNLSSIMITDILNVSKSDKVLDMCAAPGGKTLKIAEKMNNGGELIANESNYIRYERLRYNLERQGAVNASTINFDGRKLMGIYREYFDKVLLDAPCSGEGTISMRNIRKVKLLKNGSFARVQKELIIASFNSLKKGGEMLYSTCTISPRENEDVVNYLLKKFSSADIIPIRLGIPNIRTGLTSYKDKIYDERLRMAVRIIPNELMEGFFACLIKKNS